MPRAPAPTYQHPHTTSHPINSIPTYIDRTTHGPHGRYIPGAIFASPETERYDRTTDSAQCGWWSVPAQSKRGYDGLKQLPMQPRERGEIVEWVGQTGGGRGGRGNGDERARW
ncbi:hypothetical protein LTR95_015400 [Oleoguttula sp. CCFEE 5521]